MSATRHIATSLFSVLFVMALSAWILFHGEAGKATMWTGSPGVVAGELIVAFPSGPETGSSEVQQLRSTWVNGTGYEGMEDIDLRGFLDGRFVYGWNQPTQVHVRIGRRGSSPQWGEWELFRVLQKWLDVKLPRGATISDASLRLTVEKGGSRPATVLLFAVKRDFLPGRGGINRNNISPPDTGEVWWNDAGFGTESWALPGSGFASDDPLGDTEAQPLAFTSWLPGDSSIVFRASRLKAYIQQQVDSGKPLRFLLRMSGLDEDIPGTVIVIYSANGGDDWTAQGRPELSLTWEPPRSAALHRFPVVLDYGQSWVTPRLSVQPGDLISAEFRNSGGAFDPALEMRGGVGDQVTPWRPLGIPNQVPWEWLQVRVVGASHPLRLGSTFEAQIKDTWVRTGPPEDQRVPFVFISPSGMVDTVMAAYTGEYGWRVRFVPKELGPWRYYWSNSFTSGGFRSQLGKVDVIPGEVGSLIDALSDLRIEASEKRLSRSSRQRMMVRLMRLERAVVERLGPSGLRGQEGAIALALLDSIRVVLGGERLPNRPLP